METTNSPSFCAHDWQPIDGWYARYRCTRCRVIGCKFGVVVAPHGGHRSFEIRPYRCEAKCAGQKCNQPAVHGWRGKNFRCAAHPHGSRATRALRQGGAMKVAEAQAAVANDQAETRAPVEEGAPTQPTEFAGDGAPESGVRTTLAAAQEKTSC
jgi:hypothetical protein